MIFEIPAGLFAGERESRRFTRDPCRQVSPRDSRSSADSRIRNVPVSIPRKLRADGILDEIRPASDLGARCSDGDLGVTVRAMSPAQRTAVGGGLCTFADRPAQLRCQPSRCVRPRKLSHARERIDHPSRSNASSSSADIFPVMSAPSRRFSARSRFAPCSSTIFSSMVFRITSR